MVTWRRVYCGPNIDLHAQFEHVCRDAEKGATVEFHNHPYDKQCEPSTNERKSTHCWTNKVIDAASV